MSDKDQLPDLEFDDELPELEFDDDSIEAPVDVNAAKPKPGVLDTARAFMSGIEEGIPFSGAADKAGAAMAAGAAKLTFGKDKTFGENYDNILKQAKGQREEVKALNSDAAQIGTAVSGFTSPAAKGGLLARMLKAAGIATADSELKKDKSDLVGSGIEGGVAGVIEGLVPQAKGLRTIANQRAVKALDPMLSQQVNMNRKGVADEIGKELLDSKVIGFGDSIEDIAPKLKEKLEDWGRKIGAIRQTATDAGAKADLSNMSRKADVMEALASRSNKMEGQTAKEYGDNVGRYLEQPHRSPNELQEEILSLNDKIPFQKELGDFTPDQRAYKELRGDLVGKMDDSIKQVAPDKMDLYNNLKQKFSLFKDADGIAERSVARQLRNQDIGLKDAVLMSTGGVGGAALAAGNKLLRERGNSAAAVAADRAARLLETAPQKLGKFGPALAKAMSEGNKSLSLTHYLLYQNDPEYRKVIDSEPSE